MDPSPHLAPAHPRLVATAEDLLRVLRRYSQSPEKVVCWGDPTARGHFQLEAGGWWITICRDPDGTLWVFMAGGPGGRRWSRGCQREWDLPAFGRPIIDPFGLMTTADREAFAAAIPRFNQVPPVCDDWGMPPVEQLEQVEEKKFKPARRRRPSRSH